MLARVANVTLPTPVFVAGGAACVIAGFFAGSLIAPISPDRTTAEVSSYDPSGSKLCLTGDSVHDAKGVDANGELCGVWRRTPGASTPHVGDKFRFVVVNTSGQSGGETRHATVIYGDVVP